MSISRRQWLAQAAVAAGLVTTPPRLPAAPAVANPQVPVRVVDQSNQVGGRLLAHAVRDEVKREREEIGRLRLGRVLQFAISIEVVTSEGRSGRSELGGVAFSIHGLAKCLSHAGQ